MNGFHHQWWQQHHRHLRRIQNPRPERRWPTLIEWLVIALWIVALVAAGHIYDTYRLREEAAAAVASYKRLADCIDWHKPLGYTRNPDGSVWGVYCQMLEKREEG